MAKFSDLPAEIVRLILEHYRPTHLDDTQILQLAQVHVQWADILYKGFQQKYEFLDEQFVRETWAYLTMTETSFVLTMGRPYAQSLPSKRSSLDYCMVWINDFKVQRERLIGSSEKTDLQQQRLETSHEKISYSQQYRTLEREACELLCTKQGDELKHNLWFRFTRWSPFRWLVNK